MVKVFDYDPRKEAGKAFAKRMVEALYPKGAKHCMSHCKFSTGYSDGSGAYCNNENSPYYEERVRSWDTVGDCQCFEEGERIVPRYEEVE